MKEPSVKPSGVKGLTLLLALLAILGALASCSGENPRDQSGAGNDQTEVTEHTDIPEERTMNTESVELKFTEKQLVSTGLDKGRANDDGTRVTYDRWMSTGYLDVSSYAGIEYELAAHRFIYTVSFYDKDMNFISGKATESILGYTVMTGHLPVPEGAKYARFTDFLGTDEYPNTVTEPYVRGFTSEDDYTYYKTRVLKHDGLKIVCLGDSLTEGDYGKAPGVANRHYRNYPYFLARILGCETVNNGRCGYTASAYNSLFGGGEIRTEDADIVLVMLGTNGGLTYKGNGELNSYKSLLKAIGRQAKPGCRVILLTPPHATENRRYSNYGYNPVVENAAEEVRKLAQSSGYDLIDVYSDSPIRSENEKLYQPVDGLHLSEEGYEALARFIAERIEALLDS